MPHVPVCISAHVLDLKDTPLAAVFHAIRIAACAVGNGEWTTVAESGALLPALKSSGLSDAETRHAWQASCHGAWQINDLIAEHVT